MRRTVHSPAGTLQTGDALELRAEGAPTVTFTTVATTDTIGDTGDVVLADTAALTALGVPVLPNTIWVTGPGGLWVISPEGEHLGVIEVPENTGNLAWGGPDWHTLFIPSSTSLYAVETKVGPRREPYMS